jgi:hypothetical protein
MMMRPIAFLVVALATTTTARAEPDARTDTLAVQAGILPGLGVVGVEYAHAFHPNFELGANVGASLFATASVMPRLRFATGPWRLAVGAGPSMSFIVAGPFFDIKDDERLVPGAAAQATLGYVTRSGLTVLANAGAGLVFFYDDDEMGYESLLYPIGDVALGWSF